MLEREARVLELLMREGLLPCPDTPFLDIDALSTRFAVRRLFAPDAELFCALAEKTRPIIAITIPRLQGQAFWRGFPPSRPEPPRPTSITSASLTERGWSPSAIWCSVIRTGTRHSSGFSCSNRHIRERASAPRSFRTARHTCGGAALRGCVSPSIMGIRRASASG